MLLFLPLAFCVYYLLPYNAYAADEYALEYDGVADFVSIPDDPTLEASSQVLTIEAWVHPTDFASVRSIIDKGAGSYYFSISPEGYLRISKSGTATMYRSTSTLTAGEWSHVAVVRDGTGDTFAFYINGVDAGKVAFSEPGTPLDWEDNDSAARIGYRLNNTEPFKGYIDELRIWNVARSQAEILDSMNYVIVTASGLVARYGFNEGTGDVIVDFSGNANHGSATGTTWVAGRDLPIPAMVTTSFTRSVTDSGARLYGHVPNLGSETSLSVYFKYGTSTDALISTSTIGTSTSVGFFFADITGLTASTTYYFQAYADGAYKDISGAVLPFYTGEASLDFDGDGDYARVPASATINISTALTIEAWVKLGSLDWSEGETESVTGRIINRSDTPTSDKDLFEISYLQSDHPTYPNRFRARLTTEDGVQHDLVSTSTFTNIFDFYHVAATYDGSALSLYVLGQPEGSLAVTGDLLTNAASDLYIGKRGLGVPAWEYFDGIIDEVRVWNVARTAEQIAASYEGVIESSANLVARYGFNESTSTAIRDTSGNENHGSVTEASWVASGYALPVPTTPDVPTLVQPADLATGLGTSTTLEVIVNDQEGDAMQVSFFGRKDTNEMEPFTLMVIPDSQYYSENYPEIFNAQTQWILDSRTTLNTVFVTHMGDLVQNGASSSVEWERADTALSVFDGVVPWGVLPGNHDGDTVDTRSYTTYKQYFPSSRFEAYPWYGGTYLDNQNSYQLFSAGGLDFIILHLEGDAPDDVITWADGVLDLHADRRAIISTHIYLDDRDNAFGDGNDRTREAYYVDSGGNSGEDIWNELVTGNCNVFMVLSGHWGDTTGENRQESVNSCGNTVHEIVQDYQTRANGGNGWLRYYTFTPRENKIYAYTYSPTLDDYEEDSSSQFTLQYEMPAFEELSSQAAVSSGAHVTYAWQNLIDGERYRWYVTAAEIGTGTSTSPIWSFQTFDIDESLPTVALTSPSDLAIVQGGSVQFSADASDDVAVEAVWFAIEGGSMIGSEDTSSPYAVTWDSASVDDGTYSVVAVARDTAGKIATSTARTITVNNDGPVITSITVAEQTTSATVSWSTNEEADSWVEYGLTEAYSASTTRDEALVTAHEVEITGLEADTIYHFRVSSADVSGNTASSSDQTFTTAAVVPTPSPSPSPTPAVVIVGGSSSGGGSRRIDLPQPSPLVSSPAPSAAPAIPMVPGVSPALPSLSRDLYLHVVGDDVRELQRFLIANGYLGGGNDTGYFGPLTQSALKRYQVENGIWPAVGYFGPVTRAHMQSAEPAPLRASLPDSFQPAGASAFTRDLYMHIQGDDVRALQIFLNRNGFIIASDGPGSPGKETTYFGSMTQSALARFQESKGIFPAIGYFGPITMRIVTSLILSP